MAETDETYDPSTVEVDRGREQGLGVGARDLQRQRDPGDGEQSFVRGSQDDGEAAGQAGPPGAPDEAYDDRDADAVS